LISGSGREFYYSKGIIATVVEVGTRNISDYLDDMSEHIAEHIPSTNRSYERSPRRRTDRDENVEDTREYERTVRASLYWNSIV